MSCFGYKWQFLPCSAGELCVELLCYVIYFFLFLFLFFFLFHGILLLFTTYLQFSRMVVFFHTDEADIYYSEIHLSCTLTGYSF